MRFLLFPLTFIFALSVDVQSLFAIDLNLANYGNNCLNIKSSIDQDLESNLVIDISSNDFEVADVNDTIFTTINLTPVACYGDDTGIIELSAFGGTPPYDVTLVYPSGQQDDIQLPNDNIAYPFINLFAGTYDCTITDINSSINFVIEVIQTDSMSYVVVNEVPITCYDKCDGLVEVEVSGGFPPHFYAWETGGNQSEESDLCAGIFELTVTDVLGCLTVFDVNVTEPDSIDGFISVVEDVDCKGELTGVLEYVTADNSLDILWSNDSINTINDGLASGDYAITVTDQFGCVKEMQANIEEPDFDLSGEILVNPIKCFGDTNGSLDALVFGGNGGYLYEWNNGEDNQQISGLSAGGYFVEIQDIKGCTISLAYELLEPEILEGTIDKKDIQCSEDEFGGAITINYVSGGTGSIKYSVDEFFFQSDNEFKFLAPGYYEVTMRDSFNCEWTESVEIKSPAELSVLLIGNNTVELGDEVLVNASLSNPSFLTEWFVNGEPYPCEGCTSIDFEPLTDLAVSIIATDTASNCTTQDVLNIEVVENLNVFFPNTFSPNGDSFNEKFYPFRTKSTSIVKEFKVFDRFGQLLYSASNFEPGIEDFGWDGKAKDRALSPGVYTFYSIIEFINGKEVIFKGAVTLIR